MTAGAALILGGGVLLAANVTAWAVFTPAQAAAPAPCITPAGTPLLSGEAGDFPVNGQPGIVQTYVCTDGQWVRVTGYGNAPGQAGPAK